MAAQRSLLKNKKSKNRKKGGKNFSIRRNRTNSGQTTAVLLGVMILIVFFAFGFFTNAVPEFNGFKYLPISTTPNPSQSALQMEALQFISIVITPTPTLPPNTTPTIPVTPTTGSSTPTPSLTPPSANPSLLCGTNLGLFSDNDFVKNNGAQNALSKLHVSTLRIPWRQDVDANGTRLLQAVHITHSLGITPLVILHLATDATSITGNKNIVQQINTIMGGAQVFYELGNESFDSSYTAKWNQIISQVKPIATNAWFGGPVAALNAGSGATSSMAQFYVQANPTPDFLDWHEYTCGHTDSAQYCFNHIAAATSPGHNWEQHILDTQTALQKLGVSVLPKIFITEWGWDSAPFGGSTPDPRLSTMYTLHFDTAALNELKKIGVYAAYQYVLNTNGDSQLINYNGSQTTGFGQDFQSFCQNP